MACEASGICFLWRSFRRTARGGAAASSVCRTACRHNSRLGKLCECMGVVRFRRSAQESRAAVAAIGSDVEAAEMVGGDTAKWTRSGAVFGGRLIVIRKMESKMRKQK